MDLYEILKLRVEKALDQDKVEGGGAAEDRGARIAGDGGCPQGGGALGENRQSGRGHYRRLISKEVETACQTLELDKTEELIRSLAAQQKLTLTACYLALAGGRAKVSTDQVYDVYTKLCRKHQARPLTQTRLSDMISFLDLYGLINAPVVSKGRYGQTREIGASLPEEMVSKLLKADSQ